MRNALLRVTAAARRVLARASADMGEASLDASGQRFASFVKVNADALKLSGAVLVAVSGSVAWIVNSQKNLQLGIEKSSAASLLAVEKSSAASLLAVEKSSAASLLAVKDSELCLERRIFDFALHGDYEKVRLARAEALAKVPGAGKGVVVATLADGVPMRVLSHDAPCA